MGIAKIQQAQNFKAWGSSLHPGQMANFQSDYRISTFLFSASQSFGVRGAWRDLECFGFVLIPSPKIQKQASFAL
jgi:hypothetical protein